MRVSSYETLDIHSGPAVDHVGDARQMELAGASFDTIFSFQMLEHVDDPDRVVGEFLRVLKPGGAVIATKPFIALQHADPSDFWRYSRFGGRTLFERNGFEVIECEGYGGFFTVLGEMLKFAFLTPYKGTTYGRFRTRVVIFVMKRLCSFDRALPNWGVQKDFYPNIYVVARKRG